MELNSIYFSCFNAIDWSQQPVNDIVTSSTELRGRAMGLVYSINQTIPNKDEAFVDIQFGPVICTNGMYH